MKKTIRALWKLGMLYLALSDAAFASDITVIQATDTIKDSRAVINTNFSNLNSDKPEAVLCNPSGGIDDYACSPTFSGSSYAEGMIIILDPDVANTGAATVNVKSWGAKALKLMVSGALADPQDGEIDPDGRYLCVYDGTQFIVTRLEVESHAHAAGDVTSGTFADARISQSSVTQHQGALSLAASQITSGQLGLAVGGTAADLSATGGANQFLKQTSVGGAVSVAAIVDADVPNSITLTNITQITNRSHTNLSDIGSNAHSVIDTHLGSSSNPHTVTKAQVGLANVEDTALSTWAGSYNIAKVSTSLKFGGNTSDFPMWKRDTTSIWLRLADDSNFTTFTAGNLFIRNDTASQQTSMTFMEQDTGKWQVGKASDDTFFLYDIAGTQSIMTASTGNGPAFPQGLSSGGDIQFYDAGAPDLGGSRHAAGVFKTTDGSSTDYFFFDGPGLKFAMGGLTSAFPALFRVGDSVHFRLADASEFATISPGHMIIQKLAASQGTSIAFYEQTTGKWQLGKAIDNTFFLYDTAATQNVMTIATGNGPTFPQGLATTGVIYVASGGSVDFQSAATTKPIKAGATPPASCTPPQVFIDTDATAADQLLVCTATDTWTAQ